MTHELFNESIEDWIFDKSNEFLVSERLLPEFTDMVIQAQWRDITKEMPLPKSACGTKSNSVDILTPMGRFINVTYCHSSNTWIDESTGNEIPHTASHWMSPPELVKSPPHFR